MMNEKIMLVLADRFLPFQRCKEIGLHIHTVWTNADQDETDHELVRDLLCLLHPLGDCWD